MEVLIGIAVYTLIIQKLWSAARTDHELAKQGKVSPRLEAKYGSQAAARAKVEQYGFTDFLRDAYRDFWSRRGDALVAARNASPAEPREKVRLRDRLAAARDVVVNGTRKVAESPVVRKLIDPVERKPRPEPEQAPDEIPDATRYADLEPGTRRSTDDGDEEWDGYAWRPAGKRASPPVNEPATPAQPAQAGGTTMSTPTGEAVNYETTIAELNALAEEQRGHLDQCQAALQAVEAAKAAIGDMQDSYRASAEAAANISDHLAARNLDGVTLANAGTAVDAMPAGKVDEMFDQLEVMEAEAKARLADAEVALGATEENLRHIQATYGDAYETVTGNLGGDSAFLDAGGIAAASSNGTASPPPAGDEPRDVRQVKFQGPAIPKRGDLATSLDPQHLRLADGYDPNELTPAPERRR